MPLNPTWSRCLSSMVSLFFSREGKRGTRPTLLHLAKSRFGSISPAEKTLFEATEKGERANCGGDSGERGVIRSDRLAWLCTDPVAAARVTYRGISIVGAEIEGAV